MGAHYHICHECDEICKISTPGRPGRYKCPNCGAKLYTYKPGMVEKLYAYNLAALFLFIIANYFPFLSSALLCTVRFTLPWLPPPLCDPNAESAGKPASLGYA